MSLLPIKGRDGIQVTSITETAEGNYKIRLDATLNLAFWAELEIDPTQLEELAEPYIREIETDDSDSSS